MTQTNTDKTVSTERLREQGVEVLRRLSSAKVSLSDASFIARWATEARAALAASRLSQAGVRDEQIKAVATLYGNFIPGHGWTGFGPTPAQIEAALSGDTL